MKKVLVLLALAVSSVSCDYTAKQQLKGVYVKVGADGKPEKITFEFTDSKFLIQDLGVAGDYRIEDGNIYVGPMDMNTPFIKAPLTIVFHQIDANTLETKSGYFEGTYEKVSQ